MIEQIKLYITKIEDFTVYGEIGNFSLSFISPQANSFSEGKMFNVKTYLDVKFEQNKVSLYGFLDDLHKELFMQLISVSGIGAKIACGIIAVNPINNLVSNIINKNVKGLASMNKISEKMASKIVSDISNKLQKNKVFDFLNNAQSSIGLTSSLISLGYSKEQISKVQLLNNDLPFNEQITLAIKQINDASK